MRRLFSPTVARGLAAALGLAAAAVAADEIGDALGASQQSLRAARESQQRINKLDDEAQALQNKRRAVEWQAQQVAAYARQIEELAAEEERNRAELESQIARAVAIGKELQPLMERMSAELTRFVEADLPFQLETRRQRAAGIAALIADPARGVTDKYRRLVEAYRTEVDYGHSLGAEEGFVEVDGRREAASLARIGRVGLYYLTPAGDAGYWDQGRRAWRPLDDADEVKKALAVARGEVPPELLVLPVRTVKAP